MLRGCDKDLIVVHGITAQNAMLGMEKKKTRLPILNECHGKKPSILQT